MSPKRFKLIRFIFLICFAGLLVRLLSISSVMGKQYSVAAASQQTRTRLLYTERGDILDRNGIRLTGREVEWKAILEPLTLLSQPGSLRTISDILGIPVDELSQTLSSNNLPHVVKITPNQAEAIADSSLDGISVMDIRIRNGADTLAPHILGYTDQTGQEGLAGLEKAYQKTLDRGGGVYAGIIADAGDTVMNQFGYRIWNTMGKEKLDIRLTLDYHIQTIVEEVMGRMVDKGAAVVVDILTGKVLALCSVPDYNPAYINPYLNDENQPLFNRALGAYTPGSIFKIITAAAALENGISADLTFDCPGYVDFGDTKMKCWSYNSGGHGTVNMAQAFAQSCNTYFIRLGLELGRDKILDMAAKFGLGSKTGLYLEGIDEPSGSVPSTLGYASAAEIGNLSIGQGGLLVSPVQAANVSAVIANGGILNRLTLVDCVLNQKGERVRNISRPSWERVISKETAASLQGMMLMTVQSGTGELANIKGYGGSAGKTGSAETGWIKDNRAILHAWFSGYFPTHDPRYALCVFIEDGKSGASSAAPVFAEISAKIVDAGY